MKIKSIVAPLVVLVLVAGASLYLLRPQKETFGNLPASEVQTVTIGEIAHLQPGETVAIEGTIKRECPSSGCWALIEDHTGEIRIDTEKGGFALPLHREGSRIRVVGELELVENDLQISAEYAEL